MPFLRFLVTTAVILSICGGCANLKSCGGLDEECFSDQTCAGGLRCQEGFRRAACTGNAAGCEGNWKTSCQGGVGVRVTDCEAFVHAGSAALAAVLIRRLRADL